MKLPTRGSAKPEATASPAPVVQQTSEARGDKVWVQFSATVQAKQFHPVSCLVGLETHLLPGESSDAAIARAAAVARRNFDEQMNLVVAEGWKWEP